MPSLLDPPAPDQLAADYLAALLESDHHRAARLVEEAVEAGLPLRDLYLGVFQRVQYEVGRLWETNQISIAREHYCTAATQSIMARFQPAVFAAHRAGHTVLVAAIGDELHALGSRMVADFFEMEGWNAVYLGAGTPPAEVADAAENGGIDLVCLSCAMEQRAGRVRETIAMLRRPEGSGEARRRPRRPILVGGIYFNSHPEAWKEMGADGWAADAQQAVDVAARLIAAAA